jgi:hypothetical protein
MPAITLAQPQLLTDPGFLYWAPLGSTLPTNSVTGSVFTDIWPVAWISMGMTDSGSDWGYSTTVSPIEAAESFDPIAQKTTARSGSVAFALLSYTATNLARAYNGAALTVTGATTTTLTKVTPPTPGTETRAMIGWESLDGTVRKIAYRVLNSGDIKTQMNKAPAKTTIPWTAVFEVPSSGVPYEEWFAGASRG